MKDDRVYLLHIQDAIQHVQEYTREGKDEFFADRKTQDAVPGHRQGGEVHSLMRFCATPPPVGPPG